MTLLYSFGHCGSYSLFTKKFGSLNDCMAICEEDTVRIDGGTFTKKRMKNHWIFVAFVTLTLSGFWNDLGLDTSSIGLFVFKSITGANLGAVKVLLDLFNVGVNVAFGGPLFGVKGFFWDCNIFKPLDQPTANSVGGAPRSSSSYKLIFRFKTITVSKTWQRTFQNGLCLQFTIFHKFFRLCDRSRS